MINGEYNYEVTNAYTDESIKFTPRDRSGKITFAPVGTHVIPTTSIEPKYETDKERNYEIHYYKNSDYQYYYSKKEDKSYFIQVIEASEFSENGAYIRKFDVLNRKWIYIKHIHT